MAKPLFSGILRLTVGIRRVSTAQTNSMQAEKGEKDMTTQQTIDQAKADAFVGKVLADTASLAVTALSSIGDRLGLFKNLAEQGPATSEELAERAHVNERYAREWLSAMACAGYLEYNPATQRFTLPPEHIPVLAQEGGPIFFGGVQEEFVGLAGPPRSLIMERDWAPPVSRSRKCANCVRKPGSAWYDTCRRRIPSISSTRSRRSSAIPDHGIPVQDGDGVQAYQSVFGEVVMQIDGVQRQGSNAAA